MSTVKTFNLQHPSSSTVNASLTSGGLLTGAGMDLITTQTFSAVSSVSINNCFTSTYANYWVNLNIDSTSVEVGTTLRLRASGADSSAASYRYTGLYSAWNATITGDGATGLTSLIVGQNSGQIDSAMCVFGPQLVRKTSFTHSTLGDNYTLAGYLGRFDGTTQFDGFSIIRGSGTMTGTVRVYGYRNS